jgi:hypothetical protein
MTRYSRSVIPGRPASEPLSQEIDSLVFGKKGRAAANDGEDDDDADDLDDSEADQLIGRANTDRRSKVERRTAAKGRRKSEFAPLPGEGRGLRTEGSKRGPILLAGAGVIVAVFSVVVWNAYREGVRPEDSNTAPQLAEAGAFKSKPAAVSGESTSAVEASVFEQVEAPTPAIVPAPEVREEPKPPPAAAALPPAPSVAKPIQPPVQTAAPAKPAATQSAATQPAPSAAPAAVSPPVQTAAAPKSEAISLIGGGDFVPVFAADGKYVVQIAAASTEAAANSEWNKRVKAAPELFSGAAEKIILQADVNGRTVYRVRVGAFATAANADAFCSAIKAKGGACFRTAR